MSNYFTPRVITPLSDILPPIPMIQLCKHCADYELQVIDCMEAYGWNKGRVKCKDEIEDFYECLLRQKRMSRTLNMRNAYFKKVWQGKADWIPSEEGYFY